MQKPGGLLFGELGPDAAHVCVDMQRLFAEDTEWRTPWMERVLPNVASLVSHNPAGAIFTRFIPAASADEAPGAWRRYYARWRRMTLRALEPGMIDLVPELSRFAPPAEIVDKRAYSPWLTPRLSELLSARKATTIIISGGETDVCVLATVLGAVDRGYRVVIAADALCSSADETHDALMTLYRKRYSEQVETASVEEIIAGWRTEGAAR